MTTGIYSDYEDEDRIDGVERGLIEAAIRANQPTVQLNDLSAEESSRILRTKIGEAAIQAVERPSLNDRIDPVRISLKRKRDDDDTASNLAKAFGVIPNKRSNGSVYDLASAPKLRTEEDEEKEHLIDATAQLEMNKALLEHEMAEPQTDQSMVDYLDRADDQLNQSYSTAVKTAAPFPNLAREIMNLGLAMEKFHTEQKLGKYKEEGDACKAKIDTLLKLSAELPKMNSDDGSYELKEETKEKIHAIASELKAQGIDIFPGMEVGGEITKEQLASANSLINHHIDVNRTNLQELFTTKISVSIQFLSMMTEVMKKVADYDDRQKRKALELPR